MTRLSRLALLLGALGSISSEQRNFCEPGAGAFALPPPSELKQVARIAFSVAAGACEYLGPAPAPRRLSLGRWDEGKARALQPMRELIAKGLAAEPDLLDGSGAPWLKFQQWMDKVAFESESFELRILSAPILEAMWAALTERFGMLGTITIGGMVPEGFEAGATLVPHLAIQTLLAYKQADQIEAAEKCFQRMLDFEEAPGIFPYRWFYDHLDVRHASPFPWPGLRKLVWPDPHEVLPPGVGAALLSAYPQIAAEALQATTAELDLAAQGDAYPGIAGKQQWTKLALYQASTGWDETLCASVPTICNTLRGTLRTERDPGTHSLLGADFLSIGN